MMVAAIVNAIASGPKQLDSHEVVLSKAADVRLKPGRAGTPREP